ncbi:putative TFIIIC subunit triple barrel domain [Monocercomonoides exilis]|uniref:putative TFIIIC subunit triple barrel domain n=1 Tax=Monocercomonoides exilis TaxID=2049356 RepID=UPI003559F68A|nr:putative TFIIIC subunit triple barrel domain [Monocercomonoides exilis]|eukprot:MONOS_2833.1-p1 / transcript=MONOS_2833.1 / gene=MONOS_2833 / organism=Monocercomonoides_exilis_PA203 / gene_product=unspecified product / transcript_product=unspecified product / location=Mono_scaffold00061:56603-57085(-) / protein_length=119 / sequence_SO=supercontig / SO=protein_coding / is_pseudo=false
MSDEKNKKIDEELDDECEESYYCIADFSLEEKPELSELLLDAPSFQLLGIESDNPIIRVGGKAFMGTHDKAIGTNLIFEVKDETSSQEKKEINYFGKGENVLSLKPIQIDPEALAQPTR